MLDGMFIGLVIGVVVCLFAWVYGSRRNVGEVLATKPNNLTSFQTSIPKAEVIRTVLLFAQESRLKVESVDEAEGKIVLGENMSLLKTHNGYRLPVYVSENGAGTTTVEIGIQSKVYQAAFMLNAIRDRAASKINAALLMQGRRAA